MKRSNFIVLNGFDRCGSSAISKTLAKHPNNELIMHPFNSGFIRKSMYTPIEKSSYLSEADVFFNQLSKNKLNNEMIFSHWHKKHSTTQSYIPNKIHIVKTTINHFAQRWMNEKHRNIHVWGIWRDPYDIINSIKKNGFKESWYPDAMDKLKPTVASEEDLDLKFGKFFNQKLTDDQELALIFSIRSFFFFTHLPKNRLINYEIFKQNANDGLNHFSESYNLSDYNFNIGAQQDMNIIGDSYDPKKNIKLNDEVKLSIEPMLNPLIELYNNKFQK